MLGFSGFPEINNFTLCSMRDVIFGFRVVVPLNVCIVDTVDAFIDQRLQDL